jgi:hypothetical protein
MKQNIQNNAVTLASKACLKKMTKHIIIDQPGQALHWPQPPACGAGIASSGPDACEIMYSRCSVIIGRSNISKPGKCSTAQAHQSKK